MKKIFALVLAMAMVLSLSTALAATWGNNGANTTAAAAVTIEVTKYIILKDAAGVEYYSKLDDAAIVKADDDVAFQVKIKVPSANALNSQFGTDLFAAGDILDLKIDGTNLAAGSDLSFTAAPKITLTGSSQTVYLEKAADGTTAVTTETSLAGTAGSCMYLDTAKEYGAVDLKVNVKFTSELNEITIKDGDNKFYVSGVGTDPNYTGFVVTSSNYLAGATLAFGLNSSNKVTSMTVTVNSHAMLVSKTDGVYQCQKGTDATDSDKLAGDAFLNKVLSLLGFSAADALYSGTVYMDKQNWAQNFGVYFNNSNNATYAAFTPVPVTVAPTTTIPKTGSNASVIGFAMVALAVVAAAVVAVRKVRA